MILVKFSSDWADEFTVAGFKVIEEDKLEAFKEAAELPHTWYFGTNEGFEDEIFSYEYIKLSDIEHGIFRKLFPEAFQYGHGQFPDALELKLDDAYWEKQGHVPGE